jgi:hypothetical protein
MRKTLLLGAAALAIPGLAAAAEVQVRGAAMQLTVIPEARSDVVGVVTRGNDRLPPIRFTRTPQGLLVDGGLGKRISDCGMFGGVKIRGGPRIHKRDVPQVTVRVPLDAVVRTDGYVRGAIGPTHSVSLTAEGCGDWTVGATESLQISLEGLGNVHAGATRSARVGMEGMGDVDIASVAGPVDASVAGMGSLRIKSGRATRFKASLDGMGSIRFDGSADSVDASADGMGSIRVARATGPVRKDVSGFAHIKVGD